MKNNKLLSLILTAIWAMLAMTSCLNQKMEPTYNSQEEAIDRYVKSILDSDKTASVAYNNGSCRLTRIQGEGEGLKGNGTISFFYAGYVFNNRFSKENLFGTNHQKTAEEAKWNMEEKELEIITINLKDADLLKGLKNGLEGVKAGEECEILFSGKYGFGRKPFGIIPANSALLYKIWVKSISNE